MGRIVCILCLVFGATIVSADDVRRIAVSGTGTVEVVPDMAVISLGVTTEAKEAAQAMAANAEATGRVLERLGAAGVEARDIQTDALSLSPVWRQMRPDEASRPEITGFLATNSLSVRVRDLDRLGEILDLAIADGANTLGGLRFALQDSEAAGDEALRLAVADARRKAEILAEAAGVPLGGVLSISESLREAGAFPMARMEASFAGDVPVASGELSIVATVSVQFGVDG